MEQSRPLDSVYPFVWLDAIHYKVKDEGRYVNKAVYTLLALNTEGKKELIGLYCFESEGANYWLSVLTDLHNRSVQDILIARVDGLKGFPEAIQAVFPNTEVQLCVIHQIRNSLRYVASRDQKAFMRDLKPVYKAVNETSLLKLLYVGMLNASEKWTMPINNWGQSMMQLSIHFSGRLDTVMKL